MAQPAGSSGPDEFLKGFHLVSENEETPVTQPAMAGQPPSKPPIAPPMAASPEPDPDRKRKPKAEKKQEAKDVQERLKRLEDENAQLLCALYWMQQELKELKEKA